MDASTDDSDRQRAVQSVEVGGRLLLALSESEIPLPLKELAARSGLSASRAHPYLVSYQRLGLVEQDRETGRYALGPAALQIGLSALHQLDPLKAAGPVAEELAQETGHMVALAVWGNIGPTIVRLIEARQPLHVLLRVGSVMSIFGTATGRAFAASMPAERLERTDMAAVGDLPQRTPPWKVPRDELAHVKQEMSRHGVMRAVGSPIPGVNAFSAPAFNHEGDAALVVTVINHEGRLHSSWDSPDARRLLQAARSITLKLGGNVKRHPSSTPPRK
ncbi:IclR family transcriptional regulator [Ottowia sp.]|uniref:IclR family transcriptional regulator n=1 Tax=Ottowia sp. TaxID=1898956 RepID=UPI0039E21CB7